MFVYLGADNSRSHDIARAAAPGQTVLLPCNLPDTITKHWRYHRRTHVHNITHNGIVAERLAGRFQLDSEGLLIKDVQTTDQGTYTCFGHHHHHQHHHARRIRLFVPCELATSLRSMKV